MQYDIEWAKAHVQTFIQNGHNDGRAITSQFNCILDRLGSGCYATVFRLNDTHVLKVGKDLESDGFVVYHKYCKQYKSKYHPEFTWYQEYPNQNMFVAVMPLLSSVYTDRCDQTYKDKELFVFSTVIESVLKRQRHDAASKRQLIEKVYSVLKREIKEKTIVATDESTSDQATRIITEHKHLLRDMRRMFCFVEARKKFNTLDIHCGNIMYDQDQFILNDPIA